MMLPQAAEIFRGFFIALQPAFSHKFTKFAIVTKLKRQYSKKQTEIF